MSKSFSLDQLMTGIKDRNVGDDNNRLVEKWNRTGLLRGMEQNGQKGEMMARLLENQAAQLLREANSLSTGGGALTSSGQVRGFSNIAFPIVRRVFGGLVANELVSIQAMSLPSGLLFYLDYTYGSNVGRTGPNLTGDSDEVTYMKGKSIYNNPTGKGVRSGSLATGGMHDLVGSGYSKVHSGSDAVALVPNNVGTFSVAGTSMPVTAAGLAANPTVAATSDFSGSNARFASFDPQVDTAIAEGDLDVVFVHLTTAAITAQIASADLTAVDQLAITNGLGNCSAWGEDYQGGNGVLNLRRLNKRGNLSAGVFTPNALNGTHIQFVCKVANAAATGSLSTTVALSAALSDSLDVDSTDGSTLAVPSFESDFSATPSAAIPEIDIKIESIAVTATTRKLRAKWSPELAQDLNAYHSLDAEVELTQILSEQIALEIDREILNDLVTQANGANLYWSRSPGKIVNKQTGREATKSSSLASGPAFTGTVREWYETLTETIIDVANTIHRKTLRGSANFVVTSPDVCTLFENSLLYKANLKLDSNGQVGSPFSLGAEPVGSLTNRFTVYKDPYFPQNKVLVGYKGGSYLETGYVYAPYVPLIVTPTIFGPEDFTPRKGVMTRYGKKMVRSDFYGTVTVMDMNII